MDAQHLIDVRKRLGFTQAEMALELGMSRRGVMDLENGVAQIREIHRLAIEYLTLKQAVKQRSISLAESDAALAASRFVALMPNNDMIDALRPGMRGE